MADPKAPDAPAKEPAAKEPAPTNLDRPKGEEPKTPEAQLFDGKGKDGQPTEPVKGKEEPPTAPDAGKKPDGTQITEPKKEEPKPPEEPKKGPAEYTLKAPEGTPLPPEEIKAVEDECKKAGLTEEEAQGLLETRDAAVKAHKAREGKILAEAEKHWITEWQNDPEFGREKNAESTELARRAYEHFADPELRGYLKETRLGNHPAVQRMFARVGRAMQEDKIVRGAGAGAEEDNRPPEEVLFGKQKPVAA